MNGESFLAVLFGVSPKDVKPGSSVTLNATLMNTSTNVTFTGYQPTVRFYDVSSNGPVTPHDVQDNDADGKVYCTLTYPSDSYAHAFKAEVIPSDLWGGNMLQSIVSNPVQLTASKTTKLFLNVTRPDPSSTVHHFFGNVTYTYNGSGVFNRPVNVTINQTLYYQGKTDNQTGGFSFDVDLKPVGNAASTCDVLASFEDNVTVAVNCTAWARTPDGQDYAACTTVQYGYKPANKGGSVNHLICFAVSRPSSITIFPSISSVALLIVAAMPNVDVFFPPMYSLSPIPIWTAPSTT